MCLGQRHLEWMGLCHIGRRGKPQAYPTLGPISLAFSFILDCERLLCS